MIRIANLVSSSCHGVDMQKVYAMERVFVFQEAKENFAIRINGELWHKAFADSSPIFIIIPREFNPSIVDHQIPLFPNSPEAAQVS